MNEQRTTRSIGDRAMTPDCDCPPDPAGQRQHDCGPGGRYERKDRPMTPAAPVDVRSLKAGDVVTLRVCEGRNSSLWLNGPFVGLPVEAHSLPSTSPDPLAEARAKVVEALRKHINEFDGVYRSQTWREVLDTFDALLVAERALAEPVDQVRDPAEIMREALEELSRLGNGDRPGNSTGNAIAQRALRDADKAHAAWNARPVGMGKDQP